MRRARAGRCGGVAAVKGPAGLLLLRRRPLQTLWDSAGTNKLWLGSRPPVPPPTSHLARLTRGPWAAAAQGGPHSVWPRGLGWLVPAGLGSPSPPGRSASDPRDAVTVCSAEAQSTGTGGPVSPGPLSLQALPQRKPLFMGAAAALGVHTTLAGAWCPSGPAHAQ